MSDEGVDGFARKHRKTQLVSGYESDSDGEMYGDDSDDAAGTPEGKDGIEESGGQSAEEKGDDDDMFASDNEDPAVPTAPKPAHNKALDIAQFEKDQGLEDYQFDDHVDGFPDGPQSARENSPGRPKQEVQMEAFNLREEAESGQFDKDMNYIRQDSDGEEPWMAEATAEDIQRARKAQELSRSTTKDAPMKPVSEILQGLIAHLEPAETPMEALSRLRPPKKRKTKSNTTKIEDDSGRKKTVFEITECCEQLVSEKGISAAYDMSREELMRVFRQETGDDYVSKGVKRKAEEMTNDATSENEYGEAIWEYRWMDEDEIHGPFSTYEMGYWKETYFEDNVQVRRRGETTFVNVCDVSFE